MICSGTGAWAPLVLCVHWVARRYVPVTSSNSVNVSLTLPQTTTHQVRTPVSAASHQSLPHMNNWCIGRMFVTCLESDTSLFNVTETLTMNRATETFSLNHDRNIQYSIRALSKRYFCVFSPASNGCTATFSSSRGPNQQATTTGTL